MTSVINEFLKRGMRALTAREVSVLVMGNEAGDMDTVIGSIFLAMYLEKRDYYGTTNYIPVLNFVKDDLPLRQDIVRLLSRHGVSTEHMYSVRREGEATEFLDLHEVQFPVVLYDHNKLAPEQSYLSERIVGVVDHHEDERLYIAQTTRLRLIDKTGSACTLVAELYQRSGLEIPCPELLLAPIVIDTVNFEPSQKRVTERDILSSRLLAKQIGCGENFADTFTELMTWKNDVHCLTIPQHLRRDYKNFEFPIMGTGANTLRIGISSVSCRCDQLLSVHSINSVAEGCVDFIEKKAVDALLLAFAGEISPGNYCRQLGIVAKGEGLAALQTYCRESPSGVDFSHVDGAKHNEWTFSIYDVGDPSTSRKKLVPSLLGFFTTWNNS